MVYELSDLTRSVMNLGFSLVGIYLAHTFQKSKRKAWQCIYTWLLVYLFWIIVGALLDAHFLNRAAWPNMTHERIGMFIAPLAIFAYRFLYPEARLSACVFCYFMADNVLILQILFSRTVAMLLVRFFGLPDQVTVLCIYFLSLAGVLALYHTWLREKVLYALRGFRDRMGLLAAFAFVSYYGTLLLVDAWAPWQAMTGVNAARNFAAIVIPVCGYGVSFLSAEEHVRAEEMREKASVDPLTGLRNRRSMLSDIRERLETHAAPLWLIYLDLDNFKSINDHYGHDIGDQYLLRFVLMLEEMTEHNGQAYRLGGDEFAVLYNGGSAEEIEALRECYLQGFRDGKKPDFLGVSVGYEQIRDLASLAETVKHADEMMYERKRAKKYARGQLTAAE